MMTMILKNKITAACIFFLLVGMPVLAQPPRGPHRPPMQMRGKGFDPGKIRLEHERYITEKAGLTPDEAQRFFPLFHELKQQHRDIRGKIRRAMERVENSRLTELDARRILSEVRRLRSQEAKLDMDAYVRFERILPPQKLLRVMRADHELRRDIFKNGRP